MGRVSVNNHNIEIFVERKISLRLQYALWTMVLVRLLLPVSIGETAICVGNWLEQLSKKEEVHEVYKFTQEKLPEMSYQEGVVADCFLGTVYMEEDGKLYRSFADGIVKPLIDSTIKVWQAENGRYYVSITAYSVGGGYYPQGYVLDLSEDSIYRFEIIEKVQLIEENEVEHVADLTHDGLDESIRVSIEKGQEDV